MNIREHVLKAINAGLEAKKTQRDGVSGVLFTGPDSAPVIGPDSPPDSDFIPFHDLNYNDEYGYYQMSVFPGLQRDCTNENPETLHRGNYGEGWMPLVWADSGGNLTLVGDDHEAADLYQALKLFFEKGEFDPEPVGEDDWAWGYMKGIEWAVEQAQDYGWEQEVDRIADTIRTAARRGSIHGATQEPKTGRWKFNPPKFRGWLIKEEAHKRGPKPKNLGSEVVEIIQGDPALIQQRLAEVYRRETGTTPRGQLWQPCELPDCDNEPVCLNCLLCEDEHCDCPK